MARLRTQHGHALITVLLVAAFLTPLGAFALMQARLDLLMQHYTRAALEAFVTAESGLDHALADLDLDPSFDRLRGGPDGVIGSGDDGKFPFFRPQPPFDLRPPLRYELSVGQLAPDSVEIVATGWGDLGSQRAVAARVTRSTNPTLPGALVSASNDLTLSLGAGLLVNGADRGARESPRPALVVGSDAAAERALASLPGSAGTHLTGRGGVPSISAVELAPVTSRIAAAAADPRAVTIGPSGPLGDGLQVTGSLTLDGDVQGSGALLVQGDLEVTGHLTFSGLIFVSGDVRLTGGGALHLAGSLVQGAAGHRLDLLGSGELVYDSSALADLEAKVPGVLPRGVIVTGWRELF